MITKYVGEEQQQAFHEEIARLIGEGHYLLSPGGAANAIGVSRQRIHQIIDDERFDVRAWAYYEDRRPLFRNRQQVLAYLYVSVHDLLRYAVAIGRVGSEKDLGMSNPRLAGILDDVKREGVDSP